MKADRRDMLAIPGAARQRMRPVRGGVILTIAPRHERSLALQMGIDAMVRRLRWLGSPDASHRAQADEDSVEQPPRPLSEMTKQEMADWAREDPERARRFIRQQERLIRERKRQSRPPAAVSALNRSFLLVVMGTAAYMLIRGFGLFERLTWGQTLAVFVVFLVVWLVFWALIAAWRRYSDRRE
jgi:hypothetical protein